MPLEVPNLHDHYSASLPPVLMIASGDTVEFETLDVAWMIGLRYDFVTPPPYHDKPSNAIGNGPALCGPVFVQGAMPGDMLEVQILEVRPKNWGWTCAGGRQKWPDLAFGAQDDQPVIINWAIDADAGTATSPSRIQLAIIPIKGRMAS